MESYSAAIPRYWYCMSTSDGRVTRKKPFSCLSGMLGSIGALERCLEFIEFVIFGLGVKRAPVHCRKPLTPGSPPSSHDDSWCTGTTLKLLNFFIYLFFNFESSPSASVYIIHHKNSSKNIYFVTFLIKASEKLPVVTQWKCSYFRGRSHPLSQTHWRL